MILRGAYAADLSSQQSQARQDPRLQGSNEDQVGAAHYQTPSCQGPQAFDSLIAWGLGLQFPQIESPVDG